MPDRFEHPETEDRPWVVLDKEKNTFEIGGRSLPENSEDFYFPIKQWLIDYAVLPNKLTHFNFKLDYFNSASARKLIEILMLLKKIDQGDNDVKITWYTEKDDLILKKKGQEILSLIELPFEMKEFE